MSMMQSLLAAASISCSTITTRERGALRFAMGQFGGRLSRCEIAEPDVRQRASGTAAHAH